MKSTPRFAIDPRLDALQLHSRGTLDALATQNVELCAIRFDSLLADGGPQPHADIYLWLPVQQRLLLALALPVHTDAQRVDWPQVFAGWPQQRLQAISEGVLADLAANPRVGRLVAHPAFEQAFASSPDRLLDGRSIPGLENYWTTSQVLNRYRWVNDLVHHGRVLEVATGPGFGAAWLLERQPKVQGYVGVDLDKTAIALARRLNADPRARFHADALETLPDQNFDWVMSLETVEHTPDPEEFLLELKARLADGGRMLVSLPAERWHGFHLNRHHWSAWNYQRIRTLLQPHFERISYWRQGRPTFGEHALLDSGAITPVERIDPDWDEDYLMLLEGARSAPRRPRLVVQRRYARGDVLQATPIVHALRRQHPEHLMVVSTDICEVFAGNPDVDVLMATSSGFRPRADDRVINLDEAYERHPRMHVLDAYAQAAGVALPDPALRLHLERRDYAEVSALLRAAGPEWSTVTRVVALHMCATPDRSWPAQSWNTLLSALGADPRIGIFVLGAGNDLRVPQGPRLLDLVGRLDLRGTAAAIACADVLVGPDSALLHMAGAVGTPAVGLYGMVDPALRIPRGAHQVALRSPVSCAGCLHELPAPNTNPRCKFGQSFCMEAISPAAVIRAALDLLESRSADAWRQRLGLGGGAPVAPAQPVDWAAHASGVRLQAAQAPQAAALSPVVEAPPVPAKPQPPWLPQVRWMPGQARWAAETEQGWKRDGVQVARIALAELGGVNDATSTPPPEDAEAARLRAGWEPVTRLPVPHPGSAAELLRAANRVLLDSGADWVGLVEAADRLAPDTLWQLRQAISSHPEWQLLYTDEDTLTLDGRHVNPHCKPDFNLDFLRSLPYVGGVLLLRRDLFEALGGFDPERDGAEDYDLVLRAWEHLQASGAGEAAIGHVQEVLYHRAQNSGHTHKSVPEILAAGQAALQAHFQRLGIAAEVQPGPFPPSFRVRWPLPQTRPLVSILIPTRDQLPMLQRCVESLIEKTRYPAYEILIIDNDSGADDAVRYLAAIDSRQSELGGRLRVIRAPGEFNFSAMNNAAARQARGEYLLLLNNDTAVLHDDWLDEMMGHAVRADVGAVGAKLLFPDGKVQHAGVILGIRGPAEHPFLGREAADRGYFGRAQLAHDLSAVTGACLLVRKSVYEQLGGLDEQAFKVSYNDIDLCLKVREAGLRVVFTPFAMLLHEGSVSQKGQVEAKPQEAKLKRFAAERQAMYEKWLPLLARDPAYNRHLSLASTEFQLDDQACLSWDPEWRPRPRILVHPADRQGCGEYRIIAPMRALNRAGRAQGWETMRLFDPAEMERISPDTLVVQRQLELPQIEALERNASLSKAFRVFEIDDLITNLPTKSAHRPHIHKDITKRIRKAAGLCNRLVVATEPLAKAYAGFSDEVVVCPNYLEAARWGELRPARAERKRPRVGWAGGIGHAGDLELIVDVVRETAAEVDWVFFGMCPDELKGVVREFHPGVPLDEYAPKLASLDLDLAVAPLEHHPFNESKSHLRLLEYGVLGYPVICTDITPYQGDFPVTRVPNRFRDWARAIRDAVAEPRALRAQGDALRAKVLADWMLEDHLDVWMRAWAR